VPVSIGPRQKVETEPRSVPDRFESAKAGRHEQSSSAWVPELAPRAVRGWIGTLAGRRQPEARTGASIHGVRALVPIVPTTTAPNVVAAHVKPRKSEPTRF
jgi:hypothetical protein